MAPLRRYKQKEPDSRKIGAIGDTGHARGRDERGSHGGARRAPCAIDGVAHCYPCDMARKAKSAIGDKPRGQKSQHSESKGASRLRNGLPPENGSFKGNAWR